MTIIVTNDTHNVRQQLRKDGYSEEQSALMAAYLTGCSGSLRPVAPAPVRQELPPSNATVRAWARSAGLACPDRGRVPARIVSAFQAAL